MLTLASVTQAVSPTASGRDENSTAAACSIWCTAVVLNGIPSSLQSGAVEVVPKVVLLSFLICLLNDTLVKKISQT